MEAIGGQDLLSKIFLQETPQYRGNVPIRQVSLGRQGSNQDHDFYVVPADTPQLSGALETVARQRSSIQRELGRL